MTSTTAALTRLQKKFGGWGGMTERERRGLLLRRPKLTSWRRPLEAARDDHDRAHDVVPSPAAVPVHWPPRCRSPAEPSGVLAVYGGDVDGRRPWHATSRAPRG